MSTVMNTRCNERLLFINDFLGSIFIGTKDFILQHDVIPIENTYDPNYYEYEMSITLMRRINEEIKSYVESKIYC